MIKIEEVNRKKMSEGCYMNPNSLVFNEFDKDFYNAKEKSDLDLINEKYKSEAFIKNMDIKESIDRIIRP